MKYVFILGGIAVLIVAASAYLLLAEPNEATNQTTGEQPENQAQVDAQANQNEAPTKGSGTLQAIQQLGKTLECQVSYDMGADGIIEGTMFIADEQIRADYMMNTAELGDFTTSMIQSDGYTYTWSDIEGDSFGIKISTDEAEETPEDAATGLVPVDEEITYDCKAWSNVDKSVFTPPSNVQFQDFDDMFQPNMETGLIYEEEAD